MGLHSNLDFKNLPVAAAPSCVHEPRDLCTRDFLKLRSEIGFAISETPKRRLGTLKALCDYLLP